MCIRIRPLYCRCIYEAAYFTVPSTHLWRSETKTNPTFRMTTLYLNQSWPFCVSKFCSRFRIRFLSADFIVCRRTHLSKLFSDTGAAALCLTFFAERRCSDWRESLPSERTISRTRWVHALAPPLSPERGISLLCSPLSRREKTSVQRGLILRVPNPRVFIFMSCTRRNKASNRYFNAMMEKYSTIISSM